MTILVELKPLCKNRVDIRQTREMFQNFKRRSAIKEEDDEVQSARPKSKGTGVEINGLRNNIFNVQNDSELPELPSLCKHRTNLSRGKSKV